MNQDNENIDEVYQLNLKNVEEKKLNLHLKK